MPLEVLAVTESDGLPLSLPPAADLMVVAVAELPPLPQLAVWTARMGRPVVVGTTARGETAEGLVLDRWGHVAGRHRSAFDGGNLTAHRLGGHLVGLLLGPDRLLPEKARAFSLMGVDLVLGFGSEPRPYGPLWAFAQQNPFLTLEASTASALYLACEMTEDASGVVPLPTANGWATALLPWARVREVAGVDPVLRALNPDAYLTRPWWTP